MRKFLRIPVALGLFLASVAHAGFTNGGFEDATDFNGWTKQSYTNNGIPLVGGVFATPKSEASLNLQPGASNLWAVLRNATPDGSSDPNTGGAITFPHWGTAAALLNNGGNNNKANAIRQTATVNYAGDADGDGKIHIRFAAAPVMSDGGHPPEQQPYFFIQVKNVDTGKVLFTTFNFANEPGFTWHTGVGTYKYTDWQTFDIPLAAADVADGANLEFFAVAAGCSQGGHEAHLYLDMVGTKLLNGAGLWVAATGPSVISQATEVDGSSLITYTYNYQNVAGSALANNVVVNVPMPKGSDNVATTFVSVGGTNGASCTAPAVGSSADMVCSFGAMNGGDAGTFTLTVKVPATTAAESINNASYTIAAQGVAAQLGTPVKTTLLADVVVDTTNVPSSMPFGQAVPGGASFSCTNQGATAAANATCTISGQPAGVTVGQCKIDGANWSQNSLIPVGKTVVCPLTGQPNNAADAGTTKTATVTGNASNDANTANNSATKSIVVGGPEIVIDISKLPTNAVAGTPYSGKFTCKNVGSADALTGTLCQVNGLPAGVTTGQCTIDNPVGNWVGGQPIAQGATVTCPVSGVPVAAGQPTLTGVAGAAGDTNPHGGNGATLSLGVSTSPLAIPTMSEWGLIILSGLMGLFVVGMRRRQML